MFAQASFRLIEGMNGWICIKPTGKWPGLNHGPNQIQHGFSVPMAITLAMTSFCQRRPELAGAKLSDGGWSEVRGDRKGSPAPGEHYLGLLPNPAWADAASDPA
jgi:hypothetical protein